jgi:hypothetical protein
MLSCVRVSVVCALSVIARAIQKKIRTRALLFLKREQETREEGGANNFEFFVVCVLFVCWERSRFLLAALRERRDKKRTSERQKQISSSSLLFLSSCPRLKRSILRTCTRASAAEAREESLLFRRPRRV